MPPKPAWRRAFVVRILALGLLGALLLVPFAPPVAADHHAVDINVSQFAPTSDRFPGLAFGPGGEVYVAYERWNPATGAGDIVVRADQDGWAGVGAPSFTTSVVANDVAGNAWAGGPEVAVAAGPSGALYVAWADSRAIPDWDIRVARSDDRGSTFLPGVKVSDAAGPNVESFPHLAVGRSGTVYAAWSDDRNNPGATFDIFFARSVDGGQTWSASVRVNDASGATSMTAPRIAVDEAERLYIVWEEGGFLATWFDTSRDGGLTWGTDVRLSSSAGAGRPDLAVGPPNLLHAVWADARAADSGVYYARSTDGGLTWLPELRVNDFGRTGSPRPRVVATGSDVYITYIDGATPGIVKLARLLNHGSSFKFESWVAFGSYLSTAAADPEGNVFVAWYDRPGAGPAEEVWMTWIDVPPAAPTGFTAAPGPVPGSVALSWNPNGEADLDGYNLYRSGPDSPYALLALLGPAQTTYVDAGRADGAWTYTLIPFDRDGHMGPGATATITIGLTTDDRLDDLQTQLDRLRGQNEELQQDLEAANATLSRLGDRLNSAQTLTWLLVALLVVPAVAGFAVGVRRRKALAAPRPHTPPLEPEARLPPPPTP